MVTSMQVCERDKHYVISCIGNFAYLPDKLNGQYVGLKYPDIELKVLDLTRTSV